MDITVYTVIIGGYDNLRRPKCVEDGVRHVCITNQWLECAPWLIQPAWLRYECNSRNSRIPKILSHLHFDSEYTIYHDGCFALAAKPSELINESLADADIAFYRHPCRTSVYEEQRICNRENIGNGPAMDAQVKRCRELGISSGLWAGGLILRRNTEAVKRFNECWWNEYMNGCARDQFAIPMAQKLTGIKIHTINADILTDSRRIAFQWHAYFEHLGDNPLFAEQRKKRQESMKRLKKLCLTSLPHCA